MSDSDSDRITAQQLWNDVAAILINPTILTEDMEYQVPEQNYNQQRFQDFSNKTHRFKFQTIKYYFEEQTNYRDENDFFLPEVAQKLPNMESFIKLNHFFETFSEWCQEKINSIQYFLNSPYGADIDNTSGNVEFTLSHESSGIKRKDIKNAVKSLHKYGLRNDTHLIKIADLIRVLNFFTVDISKITDNITPLGGPTAEKELPYITQMNPDAISLFKNFLDNIDDVNGYGTEDDEYSQSGAVGNKRRIFKGVGKDLIKPIDEIITGFDFQATSSSSSSAVPPPAPAVSSSAAPAAPAEPKVEVLPPLWHTRISRSTGNIVYQHPHCAPTYTHPRDITPEFLLHLISKKIGEKRKLNGWTISASGSKNGYIKYIKHSKAQYENPFDLASKHRDTLEKSNPGASDSASKKQTTQKKKLKLDPNKLAKLANRKKRGGKRKTKKRRRKRKTKKHRRKRKTKKRRK